MIPDDLEKIFGTLSVGLFALIVAGGMAWVLMRQSPRGVIEKATSLSGQGVVSILVSVVVYGTGLVAIELGGYLVQNATWVPGGATTGERRAETLWEPQLKSPLVPTWIRSFFIDATECPAPFSEKEEASQAAAPATLNDEPSWRFRMSLLGSSGLQLNVSSLGSEVMHSSAWVEMALKSVRWNALDSKDGIDRTKDIDALALLLRRGSHAQLDNYLTGCNNDPRCLKRRCDILNRFADQAFYTAKHWAIQSQTLYDELSSWERRVDLARGWWFVSGLGAIIALLLCLIFMLVALWLRLLLWRRPTQDLPAWMPSVLIKEKAPKAENRADQVNDLLRGVSARRVRLFLVGLALAAVFVLSVQILDFTEQHYYRRGFGFYASSLLAPSSDVKSAAPVYPTRSSVEATGSGQAERDRIAMWLAMSIADANWQDQATPNRRGHNIVAIAVLGNTIVEYGMNENHRYGSSTEHAELRLVRKLFRRLNAQQVVKKYSEILSPYTIYTTLEPCSMCAGTLDLANVRRVVFLQQDPEQVRIAEHLHQIHPAGAPLVSQSQVEAADVLDAEFAKTDGSITDFLTTDIARESFRNARRDLKIYKPLFPENLVFHTNAVQFLAKPPLAIPFRTGE